MYFMIKKICKNDAHIKKNEYLRLMNNPKIYIVHHAGEFSRNYFI